MSGAQKTSSNFSVIAVLIFSTILLGALIVYNRNGDEKVTESGRGEDARQLAIELYNNELYPQAINQYMEYMESSNLSDKQRSNIHYLVGNIYMDRLKDYQNALAQYIMAKHFLKGDTLRKKINQRIVECLERLQRSLDAQNVLEAETSLEETKPDLGERKGVVVATIGDRKITMGDLQHELQKMPQSLQKEYEKPGGMRRLLDEYIASELLYNTAKRKGLDRDKDIIAATFDFKKAMMAQKLIQQELSEKIEITEDDVELYYKANRHEFITPERREISHILVRTSAQADKVIKELKSGKSFDEVATEYSIDDKTKDDGGKIGKVEKDGSIPGIGYNERISEAVFSTPSGEYTEPIVTEKGYHIIKVDSIIPSQQLPREQALQVASQKLFNEKAEKVKNELVRRMMKAQEVRIFEDKIKQAQQ